MSVNLRSISFLLAYGILFASGCSLSSKLPQVETGKHAVSAQKQALEIANHNLAARLDETLTQKQQAEKELARIEEQMTLSGRMPGARNASTGQGRGTVRATSIRGRLELRRLARRSDLLEFDAEAGACRLNKPLGFEPGAVRLRPHSQWVLNDLAELLVGDEKNEYRVLVISHGAPTDGAAASDVAWNRSAQSPDYLSPDQLRIASDRAAAVARYLVKEGVSESRIGLLAMADDAPGDFSSEPSGESLVDFSLEIYVLKNDPLTVGWSPKNVPWR